MNSRSNGEEDEDCMFLEHVLDKLYDFGAKKKSSKKQKRKRREEEETEDVRSADDEEDEAEQSAVTLRQQQPKADGAPSSQKTGPATRQVEVVTFQDPAKKQKTRPAPAADNISTRITETKQSDQQEELNLEKARLEVHRFGITGYKKEQQRVFEQDRAIMLGARPAKKEYTNYKVLQQQIKDKKQKAKEEIPTDLKKKKKQNNQRVKKKASSGPSSAPSGQVGRFKNGLLILSSKEIQKIKGKKGGR